jgi:hypothetical protein
MPTFLNASPIGQHAALARTRAGECVAAWSYAQGNTLGVNFATHVIDRRETTPGCSNQRRQRSSQRCRHE